MTATILQRFNPEIETYMLEGLVFARSRALAIAILGYSELNLH